MTQQAQCQEHLIGQQVWDRLAQEHLTVDGDRLRRGARDARLLASFVHHEVRKVPGGWRTGLGTGDLWTPSDEDLDGWEHLRDSWYAGRPQISTKYTDHPIWEPDTFQRFRIWHDEQHVLADLGFTRDAELMLIRHQAAEVRQSSWHASADRLTDAIFSEVIYPLAVAISTGEWIERTHVAALGPTGRAVRDLVLSL